MKRQYQMLKIALFLVMLSASTLLAQTSYNDYTGNWSDNNSWTGGTAPDTVITNGENININGYITQLGDITVKGNSTGGLLTINDTLWITGNLTIKEKGTVRVTSTGVLIIEGNANFNDKSQLVNDGQVVVKGNLTVTDKSDLANTSNAFYVYGTVTDAAKNPIDTVQTEQDLASNDISLMDFASGSSPLPVALLYFEAQLTHEQVQLSWATAMEEHFDFFTLERADEDMNFQSVAFIKGRGFSNEISEYSFTDEEPVAGMHFYRLKATDLDGKVEYHKIISVWVEKAASAQVRIYPNPMQQHGQLFIASENNHSKEVIIKDMFGNIIMTAAVHSNIEQLALPANLIPGVYLVSVSHADGQQQHIRLLIQ